MNGYFKWLTEQVDFLDFPDKYSRLFDFLHSKEFIWKHPLDRNRAMEALELRNLYCFEEPGKRKLRFSLPVTVFELLVSITRRMNFICSSFDEDKTKVIFWRLIANLGLSQMTDPEYDRLGGDDRVGDVLDIFMERHYQPDGFGGLFPMRNPRQDQREVELWYQMNQYLNDPNGEDLKSY